MSTAQVPSAPALSRAQKIEAFVVSGAIAALINTLWDEEWPSAGPTMQLVAEDLAEPIVHAVDATSYLNELWPADADLETFEFLIADARSSLLAAEIARAFLTDTDGLRRFAEKQMRTARNSLRQAAELAGRDA